MSKSARPSCMAWITLVLVLPAVYGRENYAEQPVAPPSVAATYTIETGTRIPLALISSVSSKSSSPGDRIYLETAFPIVNGNHIVIPTGSYVTGTVTEVKRPGKVKGRGQLYVRFDSITLPNGITREFRSRLGSVDSRSGEKLDPKEGQVAADSNKERRCANRCLRWPGRRIDWRDCRLSGRTRRDGRGYRRRCRCCRRHGGGASHPRTRSRTDQRQHHRNGSGSPADIRC